MTYQTANLLKNSCKVLQMEFQIIRLNAFSVLLNWTDHIWSEQKFLSVLHRMWGPAFKMINFKDIYRKYKYMQKLLRVQDR